MNQQIKQQSNQTKQVSEATDLVEPVAFADLYISDLNCRSVVDEDGIERLAANIRDRGLIHNLAGLRDADGKVGIVAGGRRLRALSLLQGDPRFQTIPVKIAPTVEVAKAWAASENFLREHPHPADEIREFGRMEQDGLPVAAIALAFGVSEAHVYRRLKLAGLPQAVLQALKADEITLAAAACFTLCDDEGHALEVLDRVRGNPVSDHVLRRMLKPDSIKGSDRRARFVGERAYQEAGGRLTRDLFAEDLLFDDPDILEQVFATKLEEAAQSLRDSGAWKWVETCRDSYVGWYQIEEHKLARVYPEPGSLDEDAAARYDDLAARAEMDGLSDADLANLSMLQAVLDGSFSEVQRALSGVILYVDTDGDLRQCEGLVTKADQAAAVAAGILAASGHGSTDTPSRPSIPATLAADLAAIARGARQNALLDHPDLLIDLLAFQLSGRMGHRSAMDLHPSEVETMPTKNAGYRLDTRLTTPKASPKDPFGSDLARGFRAFRKTGHDAIRADLTRQLAALVSLEDEKLGKLVDKTANTNIRAVWTPTAEGFFKRVRADYLDSLFCDLLELAPTHPSATAFGRLKKSEKAERLEQLFGDPAYREAAGLSASQLEQIDNWLPDELTR